MAEDKRDLLDEFIDIQKDLKAIQSPLDTVVDVFDVDADSEKSAWNPSAYKERPRANPLRCVRCIAESEEGIKPEQMCSACLDVCPVQAISIADKKVEISENCRTCGLCIAACPCEVFSDRQHAPRRLYDQIAKAAGAYEQCYLTCTRALGRNPEPNEIVLPCVGVLSSEVLFSVLVDYPNVSMYLPFGICDRCRTTTGEYVYVDQIGRAEQWGGRPVGLVMDEAELNHNMKRSYERSQFVNSLVGSGKHMLMSMTPGLAGAQAVARRISEHTKRVAAINRQLEEMVGNTTSQKRHRMLTQRRQLLLGALQKHPKHASNIEHQIPVCDPVRCTMCNACARVCPFNACDLSASGLFSVTDVYCTGCGACVSACSQGALKLVSGDPAELLIPDEETATRKEQTERQKAEVARLKEEGRKNMNKALDFLESLDTSESGSK